MQLDSADWPTFGWTNDVRPALAAARAAMRSVVLGTLVRVEGSSPRPAGTQMVFDGDAATGYFSGGCLEADVANHAAAVLADGEPRHLVYGEGSPWIDIRLLCGGRLEILLERIAPDDAAVGTLLVLRGERRRARWLSDGRQRSVSAVDGAEPSMRWDGMVCALCHEPAWRAVIIGGDPISLAIAQLASASGFETTIVRPNGPTTAPPLEVAEYSRAQPRVAIEALSPDRWTAIVTATHDDELDDEAIIAALASDASYVGVLGSAQRVASRRARLAAAGMEPVRIAALHAPIGAARCGKAPWEVAVSVMAEIMQHRTDLLTLPRDSAGAGSKEEATALTSAR